ncbi:MAG: hypothetical protein KDC24_11545 [Saprospiraceae bacterium]|nr:hypothetical protein [Saprospiraceae bacterium]
MKWVSSIVLVFALFLFACGGAEKPAESLSNEEKAEVEKLDSMSNELDAVNNELQENTEALHKALEVLEN